MANRPENHITGDKSVRQISAMLIPDEWTISIPDSDYGLDMLVEVVQNNKTTGKFFFIQAKGTSMQSRNGEISYTMDVDRIKDYSEIKLPVLFVYYSKAENKFWGRWMNSIYKTLTEEQKGQKTVTLRFVSWNEIDQNYLKSIGEEIALSITTRVALHCEMLPEQFRRFHHQVVTCARRFIGNDISEDTRLACKTLTVCYAGELHDGTCSLIDDYNRTVIPISLEEKDFLYYPSLKREECPCCFLKIIYAIGIHSFEFSSQSVDYVLLFPDQGVMGHICPAIRATFVMHLPAEKMANVSKLLQIAVLGGYGEIVQSIIMCAFTYAVKSECEISLYQKLLSECISWTPVEESKGPLFYNLANSMRTLDLHESFSFYRQAAKSEPDYKNRFYWWQEVAGVLYLMRHYKFAENFYRKARKLAPQLCREDINILIADCLVCQGRLENALKEEHIYIEQREKISWGVKLKNYVTGLMISQKICNFDATAWFNQGVRFSRCNKHEDSFFAFLFAWRLYDRDCEALTNAFIEALNSKNNKVAAFILYALRESFPEEGYKLLVKNLLINGIPDEQTEALIGFFQEGGSL